MPCPRSSWACPKHRKAAAWPSKLGQGTRHFALSATETEERFGLSEQALSSTKNKAMRGRSISSCCLLAALALSLASLAGPSRSNNPESKLAVELPAPPARIADAAVQAQTCLECHQNMAALLKGDKHIADDFHCVVCHGPSQAHLEKEEESARPDRTWRRWIEQENRYQWRIEKASLEIAKFCASCHGRKPAKGQKLKTIDWKAYLDSAHGRAVSAGSHDAPTCTDCHYAHGAGSEPLTDEVVVRRCALCHGDQGMMERAELDPNLMEDFQAGTHATMSTAAAEEKSFCAGCHPPH